MMSRMDQLCFFDKEVKKHRRKFKRYRKPAELLPFSVRLTGLSGAVRVEAYLKQQQAKESKSKESLQGKAEPEQSEIVQITEAIDVTTGQTGADQNQAVLNNLYKLGNDLKQETENNKDGTNLNLNNLNLKHISSHAIKSFEQLEGDDEEEDTQRFLFEENKFAAPNLLAQLGKLLDFLHGKQVEEFEDILSTNSEFESPSSVVKEEETETLQSGGVILQLPDEVTQKLSYNYEGLSANAVYVKREWQTASYREQAILQRRLGTTFSEGQIATEGSKTDLKASPSMPADNNSKIFTELKDSLKRSPNDLEGSLNEGNAPSILSHRRDSKASNISPTKLKARTRLEKFKFYPNKQGEKFLI